jgi:hypothetical protein
MFVGRFPDPTWRKAMGCFIAPFLGNGEHLFQQAASVQAVVGPFTVRPDGIDSDHAAKQWIGQVTGIIRMLETTGTGKALIGAIRRSKKSVLVFPLVKLDDDDDGGFTYAWTDPRMGLFAVAVSFSPLFGQKFKVILGGDPKDFDHVFTPHEAIMHEFVHVVRDVTCNHLKLGDDEEELAIMITNIFSVEINRPVVNNYNEQTPYSGDLAIFSTKYYKDNFDMIEKFHKQNMEVALELSNVKVAFNPLRQYIDENT